MKAEAGQVADQDNENPDEYENPVFVLAHHARQDDLRDEGNRRRDHANEECDQRHAARKPGGILRHQGADTLGDDTWQFAGEGFRQGAVGRL